MIHESAAEPDVNSRRGQIQKRWLDYGYVDAWGMVQNKLMVAQLQKYGQSRGGSSPASPPRGSAGAWVSHCMCSLPMAFFPRLLFPTQLVLCLREKASSLPSLCQICMLHKLLVWEEIEEEGGCCQCQPATDKRNGKALEVCNSSS
jgi:hypothetical protein